MEHLRSRILLGTVFGAVGGFLGFLLQERIVSHDPVLEMTHSDALRLGLIIGSMLGIGIGAVEGAAVSSPRLILRGSILGAIIGAIGGIFGMYFGGVIFRFALFGRTLQDLSMSGNLLDFVHLIIARAIGWTFLGAFPGLAAGAATLSQKRAVHGLIGGLLGGFLGGLLFDPLGSVVGPLMAPAAVVTERNVIEVGGPSRAIGFTVIGTLTGLFVGLVGELLKQAWVRVLAGRNEGKDYIISKPLTILGRDERADIPLFGDPNLAPQHAAIRQQNGRHFLLDGGTPIGTLVNGQRIQEQLLRDGDMIQLGQVRLLFHEKATASKITKSTKDTPKSAVPSNSLQMPAHLCPFCGAQKDAAGNCLCSVSVSPANVKPEVPITVVPLQGTQNMPSYATSPMSGNPQPIMGSPYFGSMGSQLTALEGVYVGQTFPLNSNHVTIGRDPTADIALVNDKTVSRRHAHIAQEGGNHVLYDDGSSNGTYVNNVRVTIQVLAPGDVIQFGASKFRYE